MVSSTRRSFDIGLEAMVEPERALEGVVQALVLLPLVRVEDGVEGAETDQSTLRRGESSGTERLTSTLVGVDGFV